jgi:hypothetical protein
VILVPEARVGLFFSSSAISGLKLLRSINRRFLERYFPESLDWKLPAPRAKPQQEINEMEGLYRARFYPREGIDKFELLMPFALEVALQREGTSGLRVSHTFLPLSEIISWCEKDLFVRPGGLGPVSFERDRSGRLTGFVTHAIQPYAVMPMHFERIEWYQSRAVTWLLGLIFGAAFLWSILTVPSHALRVFSPSSERASRLPLPYHGVRAIHSSVAFVLLCLPLAASFPLVGALPRFAFEMPEIAHRIASLGPWCVLITLVQIALCLRAWGRSRGTLVQRCFYAASTLLAVAFLAFAQEWNLIGASWSR